MILAYRMGAHTGDYTMSHVWPHDEELRLTGAGSDAIRPFKCLLLMPFESSFDEVARIVRDTVSATIEQLSEAFNQHLPQIDRIDWVTSSAAIQQEIWQKIWEADLVFCDITGFNPNVMFEFGVCAAWKNMRNVVLIRDASVQQSHVFNIQPIRYTAYQLQTDEGRSKFQREVSQLTDHAIISFPDSEGTAPEIISSLQLDFSGNRDDARIYTPPFAHRRMIDGALEFGSRTHFPHSWASIGKRKFKNFSLEFVAQFRNQMDQLAYIGVGLRSQNFYVQYAHFLYLTTEGRIIIANPTEDSKNFYYSETTLRPAMKIDLEGDHYFRVLFNDSILECQVDDYVAPPVNVVTMPKVFGEGLVRFQSHRSWMRIKRIEVRDLQ